MNDTLSFSFYLIQNLFHHLVCHRVGKNHRRLKRLGLFKVHQCIRHDNNNVIRLNPAGCRAVQTDFARTALAFNDQNDLIKYPRTPEADCRLLEECGAAFVFAPAVEEMYPEPDTRRFSYAPLDTVMEGAFRPGHFNGVCQIVSKLFDAVQPDRAYFGEKDFQQLAIIREMVRQMKYPLEIVGCPIVREEDGLALSSRNARLSDEERKNALKISQTLFESRTFAASHTVAETQKFVEDTIAAAPGLRLEYFELVDGNTLQRIADWEDTSYAVGCITVFCGEVRLIDNIKYKE